MLEKLKLSNFRVFDDEVTVRFRPITVLIGKNNAGKSSIINFLLMLQQSLESGAKFLVARGPKVKLGNLSEIKNKESRKKALTFSLTMAEHGSPPDYVLSYCNGKNRSYTLQANVLYSDEGQFQGEHQKLIYSVDDERLTERTALISENSSFLNFALEHKSERENSLELDSPDSEAVGEKIDVERYCVEFLGSNIQGWCHLSVLRQQLPRAVDTEQPIPPKYVGPAGEYTISQLQHEIFRSEEKMKYLLEHTEKVLGIDDIQFEHREGFTRCNARNAQTGATVNISHFGFGVSQCLPIFVQGLLMPRRSQIIVEQPEEQVHPTTQLEMGSFFAELWNKFKVGSIIETHSHNLILRLQRLIANGRLSPQDISIAYIEHRNKSPEIKNFDIAEDGEISGDDLPMQFFGANVDEVLKMGIGK